MTRDQNRASAPWLRGQFIVLTSWIEGHPHRWPTPRILKAQTSILDGDEHWQLAAANVLQRETPR